MADREDARTGGIVDYRVGFGDAPAVNEDASAGTFRIVVVGGFTASADFATGASAPDKPIAITPATFDEVMAQLAPALAIDVPDPAAPRGKPLRLALSFPRLRSFRPDALVRDVGAFQALGRDAGPGPQAPPSPGAATRAAGSVIDDILAGMAGAAPATSSPRGGAANEAKAALLRAILGHAEVRRLERAWRGLKLLVDRAARGGVTIEIVAADVERVEEALDRCAKHGEGPAVDLFVVDWEVGAHARDLERAERWARCAEGALAPLVTNVRAEVLGFDDLEQLGRTNRRVRSLEDPRAVAFRALTEKDSTRWLLFALNGVVLREAYTTESARLDGIPFSEEAPLIGGATWVVASTAAVAFAGCGWACALTEPAYRTTSGLSVQTIKDGGVDISTAGEASLTSDVAREAAAAGVTALTTVRDRDALVLPFAPMVFRGPVGKEGVRAAAELTLPDQLFVARMVPLVTELAATIPRDADDKAASDTARIVLLSLFAMEGAHAPVVDATVHRESSTLEVTIRPRAFHGVSLPEITLGAPLGH